MRRGTLLVLLTAVVGCSSGDKDGKKIDRTQESVVEFDSLKAKPPASWKEETPNGSLRAYQFRLPRVEGDSADAEVVIFKDLGGTAAVNVERWRKQFVLPEGKKLDDVGTVEQFKVAGCPVTSLDISGTYMDGRPGMPDEQKVKREKYRMLAVQFDGPKKTYHIKLTGPAATVAEYKAGFDEWLKSFK